MGEREATKTVYKGSLSRESNISVDKINGDIMTYNQRANGTFGGMKIEQ